MTRRIALVAGTVVTVCLGGSAAGAQLRPQSGATVPRAGARRQNPAQQTGVANRAQLERQFQQKLYQMTRRRVGLSDEQMNRLVPINRRFETQRRGIQREERETRLALRDALRDSSQVNQSRISGYLDKLVQLQRRRVDLVDQEQRELSQFMTPAQRARYTALQEQVRRRVEQLRRRNPGGADTSAGAVPPG